MLSKLYKLIFDLSISFLLGGFLVMFFLEQQTFIGDYLILAVTAILVSYFVKKRKVQYVILIALPLIYLFVVKLSLPGILNFLCIWIYIGYVVMTNRLHTNRGHFLDLLRKLLFMSLAFLFPVLIDLKKFGLAMEMVMPYLIVAMISATFLLRNLRVGKEMDQLKNYEKQQLIELTVFLISCLLLTLVKAPLHVLDVMYFLYQGVLIPLVWLVAQVIGGLVLAFVYLILPVMRFLTGNMDPVKEIEIPKIIGETTSNITGEERNIMSIGTLLYMAGIILGVIVIFLFLRWLRGKIYVQNVPNGIEETRENLDDLQDFKRKSKFNISKKPRERVRYYYSKYLFWLQVKQIKIGPQDTTMNIQDKFIKEIVIEEDENKTKDVKELGKIYREARYQMTRDITKEEASRMKNLYHDIKNFKVSKKENKS
ncbi:MAG: hypothetical protein ACK5JH_04575 [Anaerocolumna sp.]